MNQLASFGLALAFSASIFGGGVVGCASDTSDEPAEDMAGAEQELGVSVPNLSGGYSTMMPNHHITKPVLIGEIQADGQFNIVSQTPGLVVAQEWSPYVADTKDLIGDWRKPLSCGAFNVKTGTCTAGKKA